MRREYVWVYMTAPDKQEAKKLGRILLEERLVACLNIIDPISSMYWWEGRIKESSEAVIIAKTCREHFDCLSDRVKAFHGYECPCIVALPIQAGAPEFLQWVSRETHPKADPP